MKADNNNYVSIDKDVLDFYKKILFGSYNDTFEAACFRAYRDFNRTLNLKEAGINDPAKRNNLRQDVTKIIKKSVDELLGSNCKDQNSFDRWHETTTTTIRSYYRKEKVKFTYGHAQKWLNMTLKYLYILNGCDFKNLIDFFHAPVDNYILDAANASLGVERPCKDAWSRWDDYTLYLNYQNQLREKLRGQSLFRWEFHAWNSYSQQYNYQSLCLRQ